MSSGTLWKTVLKTNQHFFLSKRGSRIDLVKRAPAEFAAKFLCIMKTSFVVNSRFKLASFLLLP